MPTLDTKIVMLLMEHGEIIISTIQVVEDGYIFVTPALVNVERGQHGPLGFMLMPWLPNELMETTSVMVAGSRVVCIILPAKALINYYISWASIERDKMTLFAKDFENQISAIQKFQAGQYAKTKERKKREIFVDSTSVTPLPDSIIEMFEENNEWGDPTITQ